MSEFNTLWFGAVIFFMSIVVSFIMAFFGGQVIDIINVRSADFPGADTDTAHQMQSSIPWFTNIYYFITYVTPVLGGIILGQSILRRQRQQQYIYR